jgi:hypothetical protein
MFSGKLTPLDSSGGPRRWAPVAGSAAHCAWITGYPEITVRRERRWTTVGANPTRELDRSTR